MSDVELSFVSPCWNEQDNLPRLYAELSRVAREMSVTYEIIIVENGSWDASMDTIERIADADRHVKIVQLSRNFGYQGGISAGMAHASGNYLVCIDADLQDPVDMIPDMYRKAKAEHFDIVYGIRRSRQGAIAQRMAYKLFYRLMRWMAPFDVPLDAGDFALVNRLVLDAIRNLPEKDRFLRGLRAWVGFRAIGIPYDRKARDLGDSKFSAADQFMLAFQGLFSFSFLPLRLLFNGGILICSLILPLIVFYFIWRLSSPSAWPAGTATIVLLLLGQFGLTMLGIGLIGEYLSIVFLETKNRPTYITRKLINIGDPAATTDEPGAKT